MTTAEINAGYVLPYTVMAIAGKGGAAGLLLVVFMCVTSTTSAELIAVSSIFSFDVYRTYINPNASDKQVIRASHWTVIVFGIFVSGFATALHYGGIDLNWMGYFLATIICPGMFPLAFTILWRKQSAAAAIMAPILGLVSDPFIFGYESVPDGIFEYRLPESESGLEPPTCMVASSLSSPRKPNCPAYGERFLRHSPRLSIL